jgi:hypothetical protein
MHTVGTLLRISARDGITDWWVPSKGANRATRADSSCCRHPGDSANSLQTAVKHECFSLLEGSVHSNRPIRGTKPKITPFAGLGKNSAGMI